MQKTLVRLLEESLGAQVAFCYTGWGGDEHSLTGTLSVGGKIHTLPARRATDLLLDAPEASASCVEVVRLERGLASLDGLHIGELLLNSFACYLFQADRLRGVCGVSCDRLDRDHQSVSTLLAQLGPVLLGLTRVRDACAEFRGCAARLGLCPAVGDYCCASQVHEPRGACLPEPPRGEPFGSEALGMVADADRRRLTKREQEIAELLMAGYAAVNAAAVLGISEHTVRTYVRRLYRKLGVANRADFVRRYMDLASVGRSRTTSVALTARAERCHDIDLGPG